MRILCGFVIGLIALSVSLMWLAMVLKFVLAWPKSVAAFLMIGVGFGIWNSRGMAR